MMKNDILYSFVVPVYKVEKYIKNCVDTLVNQSYKNMVPLTIQVSYVMTWQKTTRE